MELLPGDLHEPAVAVLEHEVVVGDDVAVAGHRDAAAMQDALLLGLEVDLGEVPQDLVLVRDALPVGLERAQALLGVLGDVEHVAATVLELVELVDDPVERVLREDGAAKFLLAWLPTMSESGSM